MERAGPLEKLGSRERQIMEIIFRRGRATAAEVLQDLPDAPSNSAVRGMLRLLEEKGHLRHEYEGPRYVYLPTADPERISRSAMRHLVRTFFDNSPGSAIASLLDMTSTPLSAADYRRLSSLLKRVRVRGDEP